MNDKDTVKKIKSWRWRIAKADLTQRDFCLLVKGLTDSNLSQYMGLNKTPRPLTVSRIEEALKNLGV